MKSLKKNNRLNNTELLLAFFTKGLYDNADSRKCLNVNPEQLMMTV